MIGKLYGVGTGPGDPELITVKALKAIEGADEICLPESGAGDSVAYSIARKAFPGIEAKPLFYVGMPMSRDESLLKEMHSKAASLIIEKLKLGKNIAFLTIGDPCIYSTYIYVHEIVKSEGYEAEIVPGVASFSAVAARLSQSLTKAGEPLIVIPASYPGMEDLLGVPGTKALMKSGKSIESVKSAIKAKGLSECASAVTNCGLDNEEAFYQIDDVGDSYFTVILLKN